MSTKTIEEKILSARDLIRSGYPDKAREQLSSFYSQDADGYAQLQLANAQLYIESYSSCIQHCDELIKLAKEQRDALLTISALVTKGETIIDINTFKNNNLEQHPDIQSAIESFGKALGISELFTENDTTKLTVLPLAGLAHAHWLWGNPRKANELAERALARANTLSPEEQALLGARAQLSLAITNQTPENFQKAIEQAKAAKHLSLAKRAERFYEHYSA